MRCEFVLLAAVLCVALVAATGDQSDEGKVLFVPMKGSSGGSSCIIRQRSISFDDDEKDEDAEDDEDNVKPKQNLNGASQYISQANDDDFTSESNPSEIEDDEDTESQYLGAPGAAMPYQSPFLYGGYPYPSISSSYPTYPSFPSLLTPPQYLYGLGPFGSPELSLSSAAAFGQTPYKGDKTEVKIKKKKKKGGGKKKKKKKKGNINCIIITKKTDKHPLKDHKLFGFLPFTRRRRSIAHHVKALKSQ